MKMEAEFGSITRFLTSLGSSAFGMAPLCPCDREHERTVLKSGRSEHYRRKGHSFDSYSDVQVEQGKMSWNGLGCDPFSGR